MLILPTVIEGISIHTQTHTYIYIYRSYISNIGCIGGSLKY